MTAKMSTARTVRVRNVMNGDIMCTIAVGYDATIRHVVFLIKEWAREAGKKISDGFSEQDQVLMCPKAVNPAN